MNPGLVVKLRPAGPWRIGPDSGARNRVDAIYHSDSLYSALTSAMARLGWLEEWLDATARSAEPAVCCSSCFPFLDEIGFVVPPRSIWPPTSPALMSARVRWKSARFVPIGMVQAILSGQRLNENHWNVDGASECLLPAGRPGPFRTGVRWSAAVDRLTGATERHATACIEFRSGAGLWTVAGFANDAAHQRWLEPVKAAFRLLADTGFGGERSRGWGRSETPEFVEGMLPDMILAPIERVEASLRAGSPVLPALAPEPEAAPQAEAVTEGEASTTPESTSEPATPEAVTEGEASATPQSTPEPAAPEAVTEASASATPEGTPEPAATEAVTEAAAAATPERTPEPAATEAEAPAAPESTSEPAAPEAVTEGEAPATPESIPEPAVPEAVVEAQAPAAPESTPEPAATEPLRAAESVIEAEAPTAPETSVEPTVAAEVTGAPEGVLEPAAAAPERREKTHPHWLLSLFTPAAADTVDWRRGNYTVLARGGRVDSPAGSGELKKPLQMVSEGSVVYAAAAPCGAAPDVAPDGFAHPVFRAGFALSIRLPEVS